MSTQSALNLQGPIVFFGDSLSDSGNLAAQAEGLIEEEVRLSIGGPNGQASNGPTWAESVDDILGTPESLNYAVAGAEAIGSQSIGSFIAASGFADALIVPEDDPALDWDMNLAAQVDRFEADVAGEDLSQHTAVILIGGNDYGNLDLTGPTASLVQSALLTLVQITNSTLAQVAELSAAGVGHIVVTSLPSANWFPTFAGSDPATQALGNLLFELNNSFLETQVEALAATGVPVSFLDLTPVTNAIVDDPSSFGIIAPYDLTLIEGDPAELADFDEDQVAFWDSLHPTAATHEVIAVYTAHVLDGGFVAELGDGPFQLQTFSGGDYLIFAEGGTDVIRTGEGDDSVFGGSGSDVILSGSGSDLVAGGSDDDLIVGGAGADVLDGGQGDDLIYGGVGADVMIDGIGSDTLLGGGDADTFIWTEAALIGGTNGTDEDVLNGGAGEDSLYLILSQELLDVVIGLDFDDALDTLGLTLTSIENIFFQVGRGEITQLSDEGWYDSADAWGLV